MILRPDEIEQLEMNDKRFDFSVGCIESTHDTECHGVGSSSTGGVVGAHEETDDGNADCGEDEHDLQDVDAEFVAAVEETHDYDFLAGKICGAVFAGS